MKDNFLLKKSQREVFDTLTDEEAGILIKGIFKYLDTNDSGLTGMLKAIFIPIKNDIDKNEEKYQSICERNKENINKRWQKEKIPNDTTVYESIPNDTDNNHISYITNHNSFNHNSNLELNIRSIINNYELNEILDARQLQLKFNDYLILNGFKTKLEVKTESNGSRDYKGFIDIVAEYQDKIIAIELDNVNPQGKSIYKLKNYQCDYRFIILRNNFRHYYIEDIEIIGLQKELTAKEKSPKKKFGEYQNVLLTEKEYESLQTAYSNYEELIKFLDEYIEEKGYKAKNHYLSIKRWVIGAVNEKNEKQNKQTKSNNPFLDYAKEKGINL